MKRVSHIKITKYLEVLHLVQRVIGIGNGIVASNYEVINSRTIITKTHRGRSLWEYMELCWEVRRRKRLRDMEGL